MSIGGFSLQDPKKEKTNIYMYLFIIMYSSFLKEPVNHIVVFHISVCGTNGDMLCVKCAA